MKRLILSLLVLASAFTVKAQTADEVIAKHIEAIGGAENWKKVNSMKMEGVLQVQGAEVNVVVAVLNGKGMRLPRVIKWNLLVRKMWKEQNASN